MNEIAFYANSRYARPTSYFDLAKADNRREELYAEIAVTKDTQRRGDLLDAAGDVETICSMIQGRLFLPHVDAPRTF